MEKMAQSKVSKSECASILLLALFLGVASQTPSPEPALTLGFGQACNETNLCDTSKGLKCVSKVCSCFHQETMKYDEGSQTCVVFAGKPCFVENPVSLTLKEGVNSTRLEAPKEMQLSCVGNSTCNEQLKICVCTDDMREMPCPKSGKCVPKSTLNGKCSTSAECRQDFGLICVNNVCVCDPENGISDVKLSTESCVAKVDKPCLYGLCVANAQCVDSEKNNGANSIATSSKVCKCAGDYRDTPSGTCSLHYGVICDKSRPCASFLKCGEKRVCECPEQDAQIYHEKYGCLSKVGRSCNTNFTQGTTFNTSKDSLCVSGASCVRKSQFSDEDKDNDSVNFYHCQCTPESYVENLEGTCSINHGGKCGTSFSTTSALECSKEIGLECVESKTDPKAESQCLCPESYEFDETENKCLGLAGAQCELPEETEQMDNTTVGGGVKKADGSSNECIDGAICVKENSTAVDSASDFEQVFGVCKCRGEEIEDGRCLKGKRSYLTIVFMVLIVSSIIAVIVLGICIIMYFKKQLAMINQGAGVMM